MFAAGFYCLQSGAEVAFAPLFTLYTLSVAFYMPTIALSNSVAYTSLGKVNLDTVKHFPPIRIFGTIGFICSMLFVNFAKTDGEAFPIAQAIRKGYGHLDHAYTSDNVIPFSSDRKWGTTQ